MLVLTRRKDEAILIGDDIIVKILSIDGGQVKVGITAPETVVILRTELVEKPEQEDQD